MMKSTGYRALCENHSLMRENILLLLISGLLRVNLILKICIVRDGLYGWRHL